MKSGAEETFKPPVAPVKPDRYSAQWLLLFLMLMGLGIYHKISTRLYSPAVYTAPAPLPQGVNWFLILRMPAITAQYESGVAIMRIRYEEWLRQLIQQGFHPMKLSDVYDRVNRGTGVPEKTVVLVFDPGFRRTYQWVTPVLSRLEYVPAVWISNDAAMRVGHREYVTYHRARQMVDSGEWDVGFSDAGGRVKLVTRDYGTLRFGTAQTSMWASATGGLAFNRGPRLDGLNRLNVNSDWTPSDFLARVRAELPVERRVYLTESAVQNLFWGTTSDDASDPAATLNLQALSYKRGLVLDWFGTKAIPDFALDARARTLIGNLCLRLRWDEERGNGITLIASDDQIALIELASFHVKNSWHVRRNGGSGVAIQLQLTGTSLTLAHDGGAAQQFQLANGAAQGRGLFQLFLVDKFRGTARADGLKIAFTPLSRA